MNLLLDRLCKLIEIILAVLMVAMVAMVFGNVVLRYVANSGITVSEELSRWMFVWMCFLGAIVAVRERGHLGTDMLVSRLPNGGKRAMLVVAQLAMLYVNWLLLQGSWAQVEINREVEAPVSGLSQAIFYGSGVVFAVLASVVLLWELFRTLTGQLSDAELVMVQENEDLAELQHDGVPHAATPEASQTFQPRR